MQGRALPGTCIISTRRRYAYCILQAESNRDGVPVRCVRGIMYSPQYSTRTQLNNPSCFPSQLGSSAPLTTPWRPALLEVMKSFRIACSCVRPCLVCLQSCARAVPEPCFNQGSHKDKGAHALHLIGEQRGLRGIGCNPEDKRRLLWYPIKRPFHPQARGPGHIAVQRTCAHHWISPEYHTA